MAELSVIIHENLRFDHIINEISNNNIDDFFPLYSVLTAGHLGRWRFCQLPRLNIDGIETIDT